ncbi:MAG: hypothetical protein GY906_18135 [bacterium]|nr:hypothetical protein [bacterium]
MKRLIVFLVLMSMAIGTTAVSKDRYNKVHHLSKAEIGGAATSLGFMPEYNGEPFRASRFDLVAFSSSGSQACTVVVYIPLNAGPYTATDSTILLFNNQNAAGITYSYIGPISDTLRVAHSGVSWQGWITLYGD